MTKLKNQMAFEVTKLQSRRTSLGCGGTEDLHHKCAADKFPTICMMVKCQ